MKRSLAIVLLFIIPLSACGNPSANPSSAATSVMPVDYGSGVLYFDAVEATFGKSLAGYRKNNPGVEIISVSPDDMGQNGTTRGYWVIVKQR